MKLKEFNPENTVPARGSSLKVAGVGLNIKTGLFNFNKSACELLGLKDGDKILIHQDEDEPTDWYLEKTKDKGFVVRVKSNVTSGVLFNNSTLAKKIAESVEFTGKSGRVLIAGQPTKVEKKTLWGLLTTSLKND